MKTRQKHLENAHQSLLSWASWVHTHQGENGVMGSQIGNYDGLVTDTPPHALVPRIDMPRCISVIDVIYREAPDMYKDTIDLKYLKMQRVSRHYHDKVLEYVSGCLWGSQYEHSRAKRDRESRARGVHKTKKVLLL